MRSIEYKLVVHVTYLPFVAVAPLPFVVAVVALYSLVVFVSVVAAAAFSASRFSC